MKNPNNVVGVCAEKIEELSRVSSQGLATIDEMLELLDTDDEADSKRVAVKLRDLRAAMVTLSNTSAAASAAIQTAIDSPAEGGSASDG